MITIYDIYIYRYNSYKTIEIVLAGYVNYNEMASWLKKVQRVSNGKVKGGKEIKFGRQLDEHSLRHLIEIV